MTSFALGTMDKAKVLSLFLLDAMKWQQDYPGVLNDYENSIAAALQEQRKLVSDPDRRADFSRELLKVAQYEIESLQGRINFAVDSANKEAVRDPLEVTRQLITRALIPIMVAREIAAPSTFNEKSETASDLRRVIDELLVDRTYTILAKQVADQAAPVAEEKDPVTDAGERPNTQENSQQLLEIISNLQQARTVDSDSQSTDTPANSKLPVNQSIQLDKRRQKEIQRSEYFEKMSTE